MTDLPNTHPDGWYLYREVGDRFVAVEELTFARGRVCVGRVADRYGYDDGW